MGSAGRGRILREFSIDKMVERYEELYEMNGRDAVNGRHGDAARGGCGDKDLAHLRISVSSSLRVPPSPRLPVSWALRPRRIMYVIWSLDLGGAEQIVIDLVTKLDRKLFDPFVCCLNEKGRFASQVEQAGIKVIALHKNPKMDLPIIPKLISVMRKEKPDLIHTHLFTANLWGRIAAKLAGIPVISSEHGMDMWRKRIHLALDRVLARVNQKIIFVSEGVKNFYQSRNPSLHGKERVIHNGINVSSFQAQKGKDARSLLNYLGIEEGATVIGTVGRLVPEKAHEDFIKAIQILRDEKHDLKGLIVGEGILLHSLQKQVQEAGLQNHIFFAGFRSDLPELYAAMDIFVMTSLREGFPLTILEAMAVGIPVVATAVGGVKECIDDATDGLLVPPSDAPALARAIARLLKDPSLRDSLVRSAKEKVESRFSVERMVKEHESLYTEVAGSYERLQEVT